MPVGTKRKRAAPNGLSAGELLKRDKLAGPEIYSQWGWISSIAEPSQITLAHRNAACGFYDKAGKPICRNKHGAFGQRVHKKPKMDVAHETTQGTELTKAGGEDADDVIVVSSDDEGLRICSKKRCKDNPQCINYVGQATLERDDALQSFLEVVSIGPNPLDNTRKHDVPIGLKNLGATCYANAFIQVWFQDRAFRDGVYRCKPPQEEGSSLEDYPIFQLQVTFAALQESTQNVFNPVKLVESLQIRAAEQQDAQEFSKLFMTHLASEFEKQAVPSLKMLISNQFEGKQTYVTMCKNCGSRSEQDAGFLELEINLENNGKLEDRIRALLQSEELAGDNKYYCTRCDGLQDATRYTKLRKLPPVLHISVLRFIFDLSSLSRKKSKHCILFPLILDMSAFMDEDVGHSGSGIPGKRTHKEYEDGDENISTSSVYHLRGVLLHKGSSAYHGHYEAQVFDSTTKQFYQFNDETVTPIDSLQINKLLSSGRNVGDDRVSAVANKRRRTYSRKKARVEDSDGESDKRFCVNKEDQKYVSSKDAYMLIYARRDEPFADNAPCPAPEPPPSAREQVAKLNSEHDRVCALYIERKKSWTDAFNRMRQGRKSIYSHWEIDDVREESAVVSRSALEAWILKDLEKPRQNNGGKIDSRSSDTLWNPSDLLAPCARLDNHRLDSSAITCRHGCLDPRKAADMMRIKKASVTAIRIETHCIFDPELTTRDVCEHCVQELFLDKRYSLDHANHVSQFDEICETSSDSPRAWISKRWLADWRQVKPRMHVSGKGDPSPDAPEYAAHVRCEHDQLSQVAASRIRISGEASAFLQSIFPTWRPLLDNTQSCQICSEELLLTKETKQELKKQSDAEKSKLRNLFANTPNMDAGIITGVTLAIVPTDFLRRWRAWLGRPHEKHRPDSIDNTWLLCEHDRLIIDPNMSKDIGPSISLVSLSDWDILQELYGGGPFISITGAAQESQESERGSLIAHNYEVCHTCRKERLNNFENAMIMIRVLGDDDPNPTPGCHEDGTWEGSPSTARTNELKRVAGDDSISGRHVRTSNRLRKSRRKVGAKQIQIIKSSTVKDIKIELQDDLKIPTICQRLFFKGVELKNNLETMASLGVTANDTLYLREENEKDDALNSDAEPGPGAPRDEGRAFGGTILSGLSRKAATPATDEEADPRPSTENACPACTFINPRGLPTCSICDSKLGP